jgi:hypothetical protein
MKFRIVFWDVLPCKIISTDVSEVRAASIIRGHSSLMMEAARTSETSVDNYFTRGSTSQKTILNFILAAVRTLNLTNVICSYIQRRIPKSVETLRIKLDMKTTSRCKDGLISHDGSRTSSRVPPTVEQAHVLSRE